MKLLEIGGLTKSFGGLNAIDNLSFSVNDGQIHSIIGPNGAGKTTLFNMITGLYEPSSGRIRFRARDITGAAPHMLASMGMSRTFQNLQIFFNMSALENVMVGRHLHENRNLLALMLRSPSVPRKEIEAHDQARELMEFVGVGKYVDSQPASMPYGALKRLEIARALAAMPSLLLLDEPAAGLNPTETAEIDDLIRKINHSGMTVILVEHDMKLVMQVSDQILVLNYGKKLVEGDADEVRHSPEVIAAYLGTN
ncbi:MAG: ABC transporter ATP-binding protein [marine bacterium B5-7]|nr:MAG: ABC transporter ATP-binding protein [marine bacterium B5-7]